MTGTAQYQHERDRAAASFAEAGRASQTVRLNKHTSNLFRARQHKGKYALDVRGLCHVIEVDPVKRIADVEGMTPYSVLVAETLKYELLPAVCPELKTITVGGAIAGLGIESSSFRHGLVHETVEAMEVLVGDGRVIPCSPVENPDLFFCLPNSYGALGYVLRTSLRLIATKPYVRLSHTAYTNSRNFVEAMRNAADDPETDFLEGVVFDGRSMFVTAAYMQDYAPWTSDYTWMRLYYRSIPTRQTDYLRISDYVWRWDTDWFWCSRQLHAQNPLVRLLASRRFLNSATYQQVMRASRHLLPDTGSTESVIQDVAIPIRRAPEFLDRFLKDIPITPVWACPFRVGVDSSTFSLYPLEPGMYVNFGFWDVIRAGGEPATYNRMVERMVAEVGGRKAFYSSSFYDRDSFERLHDHQRYREVKQKYDPDGRFGDLYTRCVAHGSS